MGKSSENIFTAYKKAAEAVTRLELWQDKLTAWQMVADFCRDGGNCPLESKPARDTVLFWTYNNMGNLAAENDPDVSRAVEYYRNALPFSPRQYDRITVYRKIARLYKQAGDIAAWLETVKQIVRKEEDIAEITAYVEQARRESDAAVKKSFLKKAWAKADCSTYGDGRDCQMISELLDDTAREMRAARREREWPQTEFERRV